MAYSKKHLNEKWEVIISSEMRPVNKSDFDGVINEHKQVVTGLKYYDGYGSTKAEIVLSRDFILELAEHIRDLETFRQDMEQNEDLPF